MPLSDPGKSSRTQKPSFIEEDLSGLTERNTNPDVPVLFGRENEFGIIHEILDDVSLNKVGSVLLLSGDSGTGKTALAEWCLATASSEPLSFRIARATCEPFHAGMSMFPILELMRRLCGPKQSEVELVAKGFGPSSKEKIAAVKAFDIEVEPGFRRENIMATFSNVIMAAYRSTEKPVAIFVDDLERIDTSSVDALTILISRIEEAPILLLGAYRNDLVLADRNHNLKPIVERCRHGERRAMILEIKPLNQEFTLPMVEDYFQKHVEASEHFLRRLYRETEGNPLYIREVLRGLQNPIGPNEEPLFKSDDSGMLSMSSATEFWEIPPSIEDAIATRLAPLSEIENDVLETASIIGRRFRYETLRATSEVTDKELESAVEELLELDLVREVPKSDDEFEFSHGKVREVLTSRMTGLRKTRLHAKVAEVISSQKDLFSSDEWEIAMGTHLLLARNYEAAVPHLMQAGTTSLSFLSGVEAAEYFKQCLEALEKSKVVDVSRISEVRLLIGESLKLAGQLDAAIRELTFVAESDASLPSQRWALDHLGDICRMRDQIPAALDYYSRSESMAKDAKDIELEAEVSADLAELHMRQYERLAGIDPKSSAEHGELYKRYLQLETQFTSLSSRKEMKARDLRNRAKFERANGDLSVAVSLYEQSLTFIEAGVASHQFLIPYAKALWLVGRVDDAINQVQAVLDWSRQIGSPRSEAIAHQYLGLFLVEQAQNQNDLRKSQTMTVAFGEFERALKLHEEVNFRQGYRETIANMFELAVLQGDKEAAVKYLKMTDDYSGHSKATDEHQMCMAVLSQLRQNGEGHRADRIESGLAKLAIGNLRLNTP